MTSDAEHARWITNLTWVRDYVSPIRSQVDRMFAALQCKDGELCWNPVDNALFVCGDDPIEPQKKRACRKLLAREHFTLNGPSDAPPLPILEGEWQDLRGAGGVASIVSFYARSLAGRHFDLHEHPTFDDYARGLMASEYTPE